MDLARFRSAFPRQLRFWTLHCLLNALPSLGIALGWLKLIHQPIAIAAMFSAIATFILLYSTLTSWIAPLADPSHLLSRSLHLGTRVRATISFFSLFALTDDRHLPFLPDTWCGMASVYAVDWLGSRIGVKPFNQDGSFASGFLQIYATTMLEGFILSFLLLMISFFALIAVQAKDRRKAFALTSADSPARLQR
jgi:hypothetical protein